MSSVGVGSKCVGGEHRCRLLVDARERGRHMGLAAALLAPPQQSAGHQPRTMAMLCMAGRLPHAQTPLWLGNTTMHSCYTHWALCVGQHACVRAVCTHNIAELAGARTHYD